jgi:hypothetical protein
MCNASISGGYLYWSESEMLYKPEFGSLKNAFKLESVEITLNFWEKVCFPKPHHNSIQLS